jgi:methionyl-tRNA formyltransferase
MRIIVNGQGAFGKASLEAILVAGIDHVVAVYTAPDRDGAPVDPLKEAAVAFGVPVVQPSDYTAPATLDRLRDLNADLMVMAYVTVFVPAAARNLPTHGSVCFHPSLLPRHRGPSSINWPIIWGEAATGLTIFWPNDGLDEGDILLQKDVAIGPDDSLGTVYFGKVFPAGVAAILEAIELVRAGDPPRIAQDGALATYEGWCRSRNAEVDWWRSAREVYNLIRGTDPQPGAWTTVGGSKLQVFDAARVDAFGRPGEVAAISDDGITIVAGGGGIRIGRVRLDGGQKVAAATFAIEHGIVPRMRFGPPTSDGRRA